MNEILDRIDEFITFKNISDSEFSRKTKLSNGYIRKAINKKISIGSKNIEKILNAFPELNPLWLKSGQLPMLNDGRTDKTELSRINFQEPELIYKTKYQLLESEYQLLKETVAQMLKGKADLEGKVLAGSHESEKKTIQIKALEDKVKDLKIEVEFLKSLLLKK